MHKAESALEKKTNNLLWNFERQADPLISAVQASLDKVNKNRELADCGLCYSG